MEDLKRFENNTLGPWDSPLPGSIIDRGLFILHDLNDEMWTKEQPIEFYKGMLTACGVLQTYIMNGGKMEKVAEVNMELMSDLSIIIAEKIKAASILNNP